jgi:predicted homoserine dehydrogenase-like protein
MALSWHTPACAGRAAGNPRLPAIRFSGMFAVLRGTPAITTKTMSLHTKLQQRAAEGKPVRVGLIGAGKFGSMYLAQIPRTPGVHLVGIADLSPDSARANLARVGWKPEQSAARSLDAAIKEGTTHVGQDWQALVRHPAIDIIVECTGHPIAAVDHCLEAFANGKHVVNVTVEADAFCGPLLARKAAEAGVVYSLAFGDQPALICDLVDWARTCGFPVVAAGRGHKWLPHFSESTPDTVWNNWGLTPEQAKRGGLNPKMFNSFLDGSKPSIESTAVANATGLQVPSNGLLYPPASIEDIPYVTRPVSEGGVLERKGMVEVISSLEADGRAIPYEIRMGVWVTVEGETEYIRNCFEEYKAHTDPSGRYFTLYKRWHLIGLEVGVSVASVALRGEATGVATCWNADVVATAKRDLQPGEVLDGEGGYTVWGKLLPAATSLKMGGLPLGLAHDVKLVRPVKKGQSLTWADVAMDTSTRAWKVRNEMESLFGEPLRKAA